MDESPINSIVESPRACKEPMDPATLSELSPQMKDMAELLVFGLDSDHAGLGLVAGKPLTAEETAEVLGVRRKFVRRMQQAPVFNAYVSTLVASLRSGAKAKAVSKIISLVDSEDGRLALDASKTVLGEDAKGGVNLNLQINNNQGVTIRPGYVFKDPRPQSDPVIIEGETNDVA